MTHSPETIKTPEYVSKAEVQAQLAAHFNVVDAGLDSAFSDIQNTLTGLDRGAEPDVRLDLNHSEAEYLMTYPDIDMPHFGEKSRRLYLRFGERTYIFIIHTVKNEIRAHYRSCHGPIHPAWTAVSKA